MRQSDGASRGRTPARLWRVLIAAGVAGLGLLPAWPAHAVPSHERQTDDRLEELTEEEHTLLDNLDSIGDELKQLDGEIAATTAAKADADRRLAEAEAEAVAAEARLVEAQRQLAEAEDQMRDDAVNFYVGGDEVKQHMVASVLDTTKMLDAYRATVYGRTILDQEQEVIDRYRTVREIAVAAKTDAEAKRAAVTEERRVLEAELQRLEGLRAEQERRRAEQQTMLAQLQGRRAAVEANMTASTASSDGIGGELRSRQAAQPLQPPVPGSLQFPVPTNHRAGSPYGMRMHPVLGYARLHRGADFGCAAGEPIVAAADGVVSVAGVRGGYGNAVVIDHGGRFATLYGHNSRLDVAVGDTVAAGEVIAACGSTGMSTGPHSHFETRIEGNAIDPQPLLPAG